MFKTVFRLNYSQTLGISLLGFAQGFIDTSLPVIQWLIAVGSLLLIIKKLFEKKDAKQ
jgi:TRAP-type C4-dicarboxylate transport system permease small subunit